MKREFLLAALVVCVPQGLVRAEGAYSIKLKENTVGDAILVEEARTTITESKAEDATGKVLANNSVKTTETYVFTETTLARETDKRPTRLSRRYEKAQVKQGDQATTLPYQGKTVLIEKKDGKYHFQVEDKELAEADATHLEQEFNRDPEDQPSLEKTLLPGKPVALNDAWKISMDLVAKHMKTAQISLDADKGKGSGVLRKAYKKGDQQYGVLHFDLNVPLKSIGEGAKKVDLDEASTLKFGIDMEVCIDGSAEAGTLKGDMSIDGTASLPLPDGSKGKLTISVQTNGKTMRTEQPKK